MTYPRKRRRRWAAALVAGLVAAAMAALAVALPLKLSLLLLGQGILLGGLLFYYGLSFDLRRFYVLAAWSILLGGALAPSPLNEALGDALYFELLALGSVTSGALTLRAYLRHAPPPESAAGEGDVA